eukprot:gene11827-biopygen7887
MKLHSDVRFLLYHFTPTIHAACRGNAADNEDYTNDAHHEADFQPQRRSITLACSCSGAPGPAGSGRLRRREWLEHLAFTPAEG